METGESRDGASILNLGYTARCIRGLDNPTSVP
jgi:hypothetical protein